MASPRRMASVGLLLIAMVGVVRPAIASWRHHTATATGTMAAYDPETRVLTVSSASGSAPYHLAADARVWLGNHRLPVAELPSHVGAQVTVSWSDSDGVRTTHTVRLAVDPSGGR